MGPPRRLQEGGLAPPESRRPCGDGQASALLASAAVVPGALDTPLHAWRAVLPASSCGGARAGSPADLPPPLQGLFVLLFHCVLNREVRKHLKGVFIGKKPHPDESATTRATLLTVGGTRGRPRGLGAGLHCSPGAGCVSGPNISRSSTALVSLTKRAAQSHPHAVTSSLSQSQACSSGSRKGRAQPAGTPAGSSGCGSGAGPGRRGGWAQASSWPLGGSRALRPGGALSLLALPPPLWPPRGT